MLEINKIYNLDCLDGMKKMDSKSVDISFTSPPYNDSGNETLHVSESHNSHKKYLHVENRVDWLDWQIECIDEMLRVSKKYVIYNIQAIINNRKNVYKLIGHYNDRIHDILIWNKTNGAPTSTPHKISNTYEFIIVLKCDGVNGVDVNSDFYRNVITLPINSFGEYTKIHKAVMSKDLCKEVVGEFSKKGETVLDPFMGLGTTALCCQDLNRNFIGFEIVEEYYNICNKRLEENASQTSIFDFL